MRLATLACMLCCAATLPAQAACTVAATPVAFGVYQPGALPTDSTGTVTLVCGGSTSYTVSISAGGGGANAFNRALSSGAGRLSCNPYTDSTRLLVWGDGSGGTTRVAQLAIGSTLSVYARIPGLQQVAAGAYADTLIVTVEF